MNSEDAINWIYFFLVLTGVCLIVSAGLVVASGYLLFKTHQNYKRSRIAIALFPRDQNGRPLRERL